MCVFMENFCNENSGAWKEISASVVERWSAAPMTISGSNGFFCRSEKTKRKNQAPNLSNILAFACIKRIKNFASKIPSEPRFAPVSVKRSSLSDPEHAECSNTGCGCHECPFIAHGVE